MTINVKIWNPRLCEIPTVWRIARLVDGLTVSLGQSWHWPRFTIFSLSFLFDQFSSIYLHFLRFLPCIFFACFSPYFVCFSHTSYLSQISHIRYVEINLSCGEISDLYAREMWRNLKFLHMWSNFKFLHMTDAEKFEVSPHVE